jgi:hypothetical protein
MRIGLAFSWQPRERIVRKKGAGVEANQVFRFRRKTRFIPGRRGLAQTKSQRSREGDHFSVSDKKIRKALIFPVSSVGKQVLGFE